MRPNARLLAAVRQSLEPGQPTGLTGLHTAKAPRSTLIHLYSSTLSHLSKIPASSIYRQSTEALTKSRLAIIEATKPPGLSEWQERVKWQIHNHQEEAEKRGELAKVDLNYEGQDFVMAQMGEDVVDERDIQWDGKVGDALDTAFAEGPKTGEFREREQDRITKERQAKVKNTVLIDPEPPYTMDQYVDVLTMI